MCDVLQASYQSASAMTSALSEYGGGDMGAGIRKLVDETQAIGYDNGFQDGYSIRINEGLIKCAIVTTAIFTVIWGTKKIYRHFKHAKEKQRTLTA